MWSNLGYLDISYNCLNSLPDDVAQLKKLKGLRLGGNKLSKQEFDPIRQLLP
jgi:Leucine-rich repeat (LRR) protein